MAEARHRCNAAACHQDSNTPDGYVPGAPEWHLAPLSMGWEQTRGDKDLCEALLDKKRNGNREARGDRHPHVQ